MLGGRTARRPPRRRWLKTARVAGLSTSMVRALQGQVNFLCTGLLLPFGKLGSSMYTAAAAVRLLRARARPFTIQPHEALGELNSDELIRVMNRMLADDAERALQGIQPMSEADMLRLCEEAGVPEGDDFTMPWLTHAAFSLGTWEFEAEVLTPDELRLSVARAAYERPPKLHVRIVRDDTTAPPTYFTAG